MNAFSALSSQKMLYSEFSNVNRGQSGKVILYGRSDTEMLPMLVGLSCIEFYSTIGLWINTTDSFPERFATCHGKYFKGDMEQNNVLSWYEAKTNKNKSKDYFAISPNVPKIGWIDTPFANDAFEIEFDPVNNYIGFDLIGNPNIDLVPEVLNLVIIGSQ